MVRRIKVFAVLLFASCLFCFSSYAEFTSSDSTNLSNIRSNVSTIASYIDYLPDLSLIKQYTQATYNWMVNTTSGLVSYLNQIIRKFDTLDSIKSSINQILNALGAGGSDVPIYHEFQNSLEYMTSWSSGNYQIDNNYIVPNISSSGSYPIRDGLNVYIAPGSYIVSCKTNVSWRTSKNSNFINGDGSVFVRYEQLDQLIFYFDSQPFWFNLDIYPADSDQSGDQVIDNVGTNIDSSTSDLDSGVDQLEGLEDQVFGSLDTSLGSIDFSGSALGQVVSGFTFIRAVFSAIYSSSPYISVLINLSCMFGVLALFLRVQPRFSRWEREHRDRSD